jgi:hypothetical protein
MAGGKLWTKEEDMYLRKQAATGISAREIAAKMQEKFGRRLTPGALQQHAIKLNVPVQGTRKAADSGTPITAKSVGLHGTVSSLRKELRKARGDLKTALVKVGELSDARALIEEALEPLTPAPTRFKSPRKWTRKGKRSYLAVPLVSDWQVGEVVKAEACSWGEFNWKIAQRRVETYAREFVQWIDAMRSGYAVKDVTVVVLGDMISGDIHDGLRVTNEFPIPVQAVNAGDLLATFASLLAAHAEHVKIEFVGLDNHGRLTKKAQWKDGGLNNMNYVVFHVARGRLARHVNVDMTYHLDSPAYIDLDGRPVLAMHGHQFQSWMGIPYYGLQRYRGQKAIKHMEENKPFYEIFCAHWHNAARPPGAIMNGCLPGTTELDSNKGRHGPPSQTSMLWHPRYGPFNVTDWLLERKG